MTMKYIIATLAVAAGIALGVPGTAHADPVRCKDVPTAFGSTSHVCQNADGSVTNCVWGSVCGPVYAGLPPGFWDQR
jgi:hypothetical protein